MTTTLSVRQAAELLGISASTAYKLVREDQFPVPTLKFGGRILVPTQPLLEALHLEELPTQAA